MRLALSGLAGAALFAMGMLLAPQASACSPTSIDPRFARPWTTGDELPSDSLLIANVGSEHVTGEDVVLLDSNEQELAFEWSMEQNASRPGDWLRVRPLEPFVLGQEYTWSLGKYHVQDFVAVEPAGPINVDRAEFMVEVIHEGFIELNGCWGPTVHYYRLAEVSVTGVVGHHSDGAFVELDGWGSGHEMVILDEGEWNARVRMLDGDGGCFDVFVEDMAGTRHELGTECIDAVEPWPVPEPPGASTGAAGSSTGGEAPDGDTGSPEPSPDPTPMPDPEDEGSTSGADEQSHDDVDATSGRGCACRSSLGAGPAFALWPVLFVLWNRRRAITVRS